METHGSNPKVNRRSFAEMLLDRLGIRPNRENVYDLKRWEQAEGGQWGPGSRAHDNPLNTTYRTRHGKTINEAGVKSYESWAEGLQATAATLELDYYRPIRRILAHGGSFRSFENAVVESRWGTERQSF